MKNKLRSNENQRLPLTVKYFGELPDEAKIRLPSMLILFGISRSTLYRRIKHKTIPEQEIEGRIATWIVSEVRAALEKKAN